MASLGLFEADQELAEAVEPGVGAFDDPATGLVARVLAFAAGLFAALFDVWAVVAGLYCDAGRFSLIARIATEVLRAVLVGLGPLDYDLVQRRLQQLDVMPVGPAGDER